MSPDHPLLDLTVFDSNQLGDPPQRRLHMSSLENGKRHLLILNANMEELERSLMAAEERRWYQRIRRQGLSAYDPIVRRILAAVREAAAIWFQQELDDPTSMLANIALTGEQADLTEQLRIELPEKYFRGTDLAQRDVDRHMVAEAAVTSRLLLVSKYKGIRHKQLNQWLRKKGLVRIIKLDCYYRKGASCFSAFDRLPRYLRMDAWRLSARHTVSGKRRGYYQKQHRTDSSCRA